jgi:hypothetical protein
MDFENRTMRETGQFSFFKQFDVWLILNFDQKSWTPLQVGYIILA